MRSTARVLESPAESGGLRHRRPVRRGSSLPDKKGGEFWGSGEGTGSRSRHTAGGTGPDFQKAPKVRLKCSAFPHRDNDTNSFASRKATTQGAFRLLKRPNFRDRSRPQHRGRPKPPTGDHWRRLPVLQAGMVCGANRDSSGAIAAWSSERNKKATRIRSRVTAGIVLVPQTENVCKH